MRLGIGHAVALEMRGQHEQVGDGDKARRGVRPAARRARRCGRRGRGARYRASSLRRRLGSRVRSPAMVSRHGRSADRGERLDQHVDSPCAARPRRPRAGERCRRCCPSRDRARSVPGGSDGDAFHRHVIVVDQEPRGRWLRDDDAPRRGERRALADTQRVAVVAATGPFPAPADDAPARSADCAARNCRAASGSTPKASPSTTIGQPPCSGKPCAAPHALRSCARARKVVAEVDHVDLPAERAQLRDDARGRRHSRRSASQDRPAPRTQAASPQGAPRTTARATCDSEIVTRIARVRGRRGRARRRARPSRAGRRCAW